jgi:N-methylhydantoinase A/oxoprolinase/acetone carboxylase beta subunit/DUF917 family protein
LRIGVDVGGTNTDGVIINPEEIASPDKGILAWHKAPTTPDPGKGISHAISQMFHEADIQPSDVASVTIGTTHFVNAVVERDASRLSKVAVVRLCGPFSKFAPPCVDWPDDIRKLVLGHYALLTGGLEVDGNLIDEVVESEVLDQCRLIREKGIQAVVVNGVFSPIDTVERQEQRVAAIIKREVNGCNVVCSKDVANLGFLERENAAILNASILRFARQTIHSFHKPVRQLGIRCPVFVTQNDGTVLTSAEAARLPIKTFSSGPTNSMRGAALLAQGQLSEAVMVVDIGGTTTDVGLLQTNGFPRQQAAYSELAGVRMNFPCPDIKSIGLGGGSVVRLDGDASVGPDSVGYKLTNEALVFGGKTLTTTDCTVLSKPDIEIGDVKLAINAVSPKSLAYVQTVIKSKLEHVIDKMKTSPEDIPVLLVGGGAIIAPDELRGASKVIKPEWAGVANAIGAAMARVSAVIDIVKSTEAKTEGQLQDELGKEALAKVIEAGASPDSAEVVELETLPLQVRLKNSHNVSALLMRKQYIDNKTRLIARAAGDFDFSRAVTESNDIETEEDMFEKATAVESERHLQDNAKKESSDEIDVVKYKPRIRNRVWYISETDLEWITIGCYILGTGGGGSPYASMIRLREELRQGAIVTVVSPEDLQDDDTVGCGGGIGSPTVSIEKLAGNELLEAQQELAKILNKPISHTISVEIGGGNGLQSMILGSSLNLNVPTVDGDWMGRAYPTMWQTTPVVFNERRPVWCPAAMSDGNGNVVVIPKAASDFHMERMLRAALSTMGSHCATAESPVSGAETKRWAVEHTVSQAWRIGRGVARARKENRVDNVAEAIIDECGGPGAGQVLWKGKIVGVERMLRGGYVYGECIIEGVDVRLDEKKTGGSQHSSNFEGRIKIPFKNENIAALRIRDDGGQERQEDIMAIVPDLITVIDAQNGEAIGTPEYRYGLLVVVLGLAANDKWTTKQRGIQLGGPEAFGFGHLTYQPLGKFVKPASVIDEYDESE